MNVVARIGVNYRLVEMGFITNKKDMKYLKENYDKFSKEIVGAINGKPICGTSSGNKRITWNCEGIVTANTTIKVRRKPGLSGPVVDKASWIFNNQYVPFYSVTKMDGYWWIKFKYPTNLSAGYFYMAICKITDKEERLKKEKKFFGKIGYK